MDGFVFDPIVSLEGVFGADSDQEDTTSHDEKQKEVNSEAEECTRQHQFPGMAITIREFSFHAVNATLVWPGAAHMAGWATQPENLQMLRGKHILELGSGTGALSIFLRSHGLDITTSDYADPQIEQNIAHNCKLNGLAPATHLAHSWGTDLEALEQHCCDHGPYDFLIASDILLYTKSYPALIQTLRILLKPRYRHAASCTCSSASCCSSSSPSSSVPATCTLIRPVFYMSWRRRFLDKDPDNLFQQLTRAGDFRWEQMPNRIFRIEALPASEAHVEA